MTPSSDTDELFMREALRLADEAAALGEVPVGAVAVLEGQVIARGFNTRERDADPFAHAELVALAAAARALKRWRLTGVTLYVTLEPCPMCAGAIVNSRVSRVVFGCSDPKAGAAGSVVDLLAHPALNHRPEVRSGVLAEEASGQLRAFFRVRRLSGGAGRPQGGGTEV
jgi:tRNA(adenine34) deaminase